MNDLKNEFKTKTMTYIAGALGLVAGLAWNDAIKELIAQFFPLAQSTLVAKFFYAVLVTLLVTVLIIYLNKIFHASADK